VLIRDEADRIRALVDRMEVFGEKPIERRAVNIHRVLEHVRRLAQTGFAQDLRITEVYDPSLPPVWGNRDQLVQVLLNLVKNAAEAINGEPDMVRRGGGSAWRAPRGAWHCAEAAPAAGGDGAGQWPRDCRGHKAASVRAVRERQADGQWPRACVGGEDRRRP
jgi:hypothetical protein